MHVLDAELLRSFIAIAETGSFTQAARQVHKTQSAVSMQMKRLEDTLQKTLFVRDGRASRLTTDGEHLLDYANRIVNLNREAIQAFSQPELCGRVRMGTPDDYADRLLPQALGRFARSHPMIQVDVECLGSDVLTDRIDAGALDLAVITCDGRQTRGDVVRTEPLVWAGSERHSVHEQEVLPVALSHHGCAWRRMALEALDRSARDYRVAYASANSLAVAAAVLEGLAVAAVPEMVLRPGMRVLGAEHGLPQLGNFQIGLIRRSRDMTSAAHALADHIAATFANFGRPAVAAE